MGIHESVLINSIKIVENCTKGALQLQGYDNDLSEIGEVEEVDEYKTTVKINSLSGSPVESVRQSNSSKPEKLKSKKPRIAIPCCVRFCFPKRYNPKVAQDDD